MPHPSSKWNTIRIILLLLMFLCIYEEVGAEVICNEFQSPLIQGRIEKGDFLKLLHCFGPITVEDEVALLNARLNPSLFPPISFTPIYPTAPNYVHFNSEGGDVNEAIKIGRFMRESLADAYVEIKCSSACFLAFIGATRTTYRLADDNNRYINDGLRRVGIHRMFYDEATLRKLNIKDYESFYNELKKSIRQYCYDMDVPTSIVEKMFSITSSDIYFLTIEELTQMENHPAYDEWIKAKCPNALTRKESKEILPGF